MGAKKSSKKSDKASSKAERAAERRRRRSANLATADDEELESDVTAGVDADEDDSEDDEEEVVIPAKKPASARTTVGAPGKSATKAKKVKTEPHDVIATRLGYYGLERRRPGDEFEMEVPLEDGEPVFPSWVVPAEDYVPEEEEKPKKRGSRRAAEVEV